MIACARELVHNVVNWIIGLIHRILLIYNEEEEIL